MAAKRYITFKGSVQNKPFLKDIMNGDMIVPHEALNTI